MTEDDLGGLQITVHSEVILSKLESASEDDLFSAVRSALREMSRLDQVLDRRLSAHVRRRSDLSSLFEKVETTEEVSLTGCGDREVLAVEDSSSWITVSSEDISNEDNLPAEKEQISDIDLEKEVEQFLSSTDGDSDQEILSSEDVTSIDDLDSIGTLSINELTDHSYMRKLTGNAAEVMDSLGNSASYSISEFETRPADALDNQPVGNPTSEPSFNAKQYLKEQFQKVTQMRNQEQLNLSEMKRRIANLRKAAQADWNDVEEPIRSLRIPADVSKMDSSDLLEERPGEVQPAFEELDAPTLTADKFISGSNTWKRWRTALSDMHRSESADLFTEPGFLDEGGLDSLAQLDADNINKKMKSLKDIVRSASQEFNNLKRLGMKQENKTFGP